MLGKKGVPASYATYYSMHIFFCNLSLMIILFSELVNLIGINASPATSDAPRNKGSLGSIIGAAVVAGTMLGLHTNASRSMVVGVIVTIFGICMYGSPLSIMLKVIKTKRAEYLPKMLSIACFLNGICWSIYALLRFDPYILTGSGVGALLAFVQPLLIVIYRNSPPKESLHFPLVVAIFSSPFSASFAPGFAALELRVFQKQPLYHPEGVLRPDVWQFHVMFGEVGKDSKVNIPDDDDHECLLNVQGNPDNCDDDRDSQGPGSNPKNEGSVDPWNPGPL
ncbi:Bidirectional sugar transporter SWEET6a [Capsicum annuum]|uniref:Bidirectional sugar transporter SWEET n=1 Tax=Capsicum annuum TaxID=4072 RepID=A0A2G2ZJK6_CAPAN|nr:Bidirectional sugar transporter SWEET6a [Capsicum annuum]